VTPGLLRSMYALLTSDGSAPMNSQAKAVDEAVLKFLAAGGDVELFPDLRALNSGERGKYDLFWAAGARVLASLEACAADDRHGENRTLLQPLSVPDLRRRIVEQLVSEGHPEPTAPCDEWISFQFAPRCPSRTIATRHTGRWDITLKVISTTLRKSNEDSHYCNALELNVKAFLHDADLVLEREFKVLLEHRQQQDRARQAGQGIGWGAVLNNPDAAISTGDIERYLTATLERIVRVSNDDKCKVPTGEPGNPVGTNVRPMAAGVALKSVRLLAMDHSWHRASITPTVTLLSDVAHGFETGNWRHGQLVVSIKDSVLEPSSAFRNAAELATTVLAACAKPIILDKRTDGGPEQNTTFGSVQLADVALWKKTGADLCMQTAKAAAQRSGNPKADLWHAASARCTIGCSECGLPRVLYSLNRLSPEEKDLAQSAVDNVSSFVCGATQLFDEGHQLASKLFVRSANACGLPVEKQYYTSKQFRDCCTWCGLTDPLELEDLESLNLNGAKGYSICKRCYADGKKVITFGKATKTALHQSKAKGRKRAKKAVVDSSEEEEDDEDGDDEEEDVNEGEGEGEEDEDEGEGEENEDEGEGEDDDHQYEVEIILAKKEFTEPRKGKVMKWAVKWQGFDETSQMTWEPAGNLTNVRSEVDAFERRLASMPSLTAFTAPAGSSACCFGSTCRHQSDRETTQNPCSVCTKNMHHMCASEHLFLKPFYSELEHSNICFDCSLLIALMEKRTPFGLTGAQLMFEPYYRQLRGVASLAPTPFGLGALLTTKALKLFEPDALMARTLPTTPCQNFSAIVSKPK